MSKNTGRKTASESTDDKDDDGESSADLDAQIKSLTEKKRAADVRAAEKRNAMGDDDFAESKPDEQGKFDGEVREPGWRWDRSRNDWFQHRGTDLTKAGKLPYGFESLGDGSPENPHRVQQVQRWM